MAAEEDSEHRPGLALVSLPRRPSDPFVELGRRAALALAILMFSTLIVWLDADSYVDNTAGDGVSFLDALYYSTVTITTTGYGDITPLAPHARLLGAILITPLRILFLILLVGTTIEVLANQGSRAIRDLRWRRRMQDHVVVVGYGTKGRSAVNTLRRHGEETRAMVVIDSARRAIADANRDGLAAFEGDATRRDLLRRAGVPTARQVIICLDRDDAAILATLTVRQLNPSVSIAVSVREHLNVPLVRQSGATSVVTSSDTVGRLMGLSAISPNLGATIQDLLTSGTGLEVHQRPATTTDVSRDPSTLADERLVGIVRDGRLRRFYETCADRIEPGDELIVVRQASAAARNVPDIDE